MINCRVLKLFCKFIMNEKDLEKEVLKNKKANSTEESENDLLSLEIQPPQILADENEPKIKTELFDEDSVEEDSIIEEETTPAQTAVFKELSEPKLPQLEKENRARLQMQSPNRIHFYWSMKNNPFQMLGKAFGGNSGNYQLVAKLINQTTGAEEINPVEAEGDWWYDVDANSKYRAEIGFYAVNRPYFRVMFSNIIETPRKTPSQHRAAESQFSVSANQFAEVLDRSGYKQDAMEVAFAGDDAEYADFATNNAFTKLTGKNDVVFSDSAEMRYALLALASGIRLDSLRGEISRSIYNSLKSNELAIDAKKTLNALEESFGEFEEEIFEEETTHSLPAVFGASLINFPRITKRKTIKKGVPRDFVPKFSPISSLR